MVTRTSLLRGSESVSGSRSFSRGRRSSCWLFAFRGLAMRGRPMLFAEAAFAAALAALLEGAGSIARLRHFPRLPEPIVLAAVALRDNFVVAILGFATCFGFDFGFFHEILSRCGGAKTHS